MTWLAFVLGFVLGGLSSFAGIILLGWHDENVLDSEEEYIDNTPTFR